MPPRKAITLRVGKPQHAKLEDDTTAASEAQLEHSAHASSSSLTDLDVQRASSGLDADGDVSMSDQPDSQVPLEASTSSQPTASASSRPRRARASRVPQPDVKAELAAQAQTTPRSRRSRRQSSIQVAKHEDEDEEKSAAAVDEPVDDTARRRSSRASAARTRNADEEDGEDGDEAEDREEGGSSQRPSRSPAKARARGKAQAQAQEQEQSQSQARSRTRGRASAAARPSRTKAATSGRSRGKSRQAEASGEEDNNVSDAGDSDNNADEAEKADDAEDQDDEENAEENDNDSGGDDNDENTGVDAEGFKTITIKGKVYRLDGDEVILESDPDGDKKVDVHGVLQGGRQYKAYNFTSDSRDDPKRVYMLSIDAAKAANYRDSLYFFRKNPVIVKVELNQAEKDKLIEAGRLSGQLKTRNVTMVAARNVYKLHGARFLSGGKTIIDDYYEANERAKGVVEGKTVGGMSFEELEKKREADRERDRSRRKPDSFSYATFDPQGEAVVTTFGDNGQSPFVRAGNWISRKLALSRAEINESNWMLEMARSVRGINAELTETRRERLVAFRRFDDGGPEGPSAAADEADDGDADPDEDEEAENDRPPWEREAEGEEAALKRKAKAAERLRAKRQRGPPIGLFEPATHMPHFSVSTQPAWAFVEKVAPRPHFVHDAARDAGSTRPVLGGERLGSGAWGVASFTTEAVPPPPPSRTVTIEGGSDLNVAAGRAA